MAKMSGGGDVNIEVTSSGDPKGLNDMGKAVESVGDKAEEQTKKLSKLSEGWDAFKDSIGAAAIPAAGIVAGVAGLGFAATQTTAQFQQNRIAFNTMLGDEKKAGDLMQEISKFATATPFELPQVVEGSKSLLAYGFSAEQVIPTFKALGNIASGVGMDKLPQLTLAFGQVKAAGQLTGNELRQFSEAGVPLLDILAQGAGKTTAEMKEMVSAGEVGFPAVEAALNALGGEGGKWGDLMDQQSKTFNGTIANLQDNFGRLLRTFMGMDDQGNIKEGSLFDMMTQGATSLLNALNAAMPSVTAFFGFLQENKIVLAIIAGIFVGLVTLAILPLVAAFWAALPAILAFSAAGAALGAIIYLVSTNFTWIQTALTATGVAIMGFLSATWNVLVNAFAIGVALIRQHFGLWQLAFNILLFAMTGGLTSMKNGWTSSMNFIKDVVSSVWGGIVSTIRNSINSIINGINTLVRGFNKVSSKVPGGGFTLGEIPNFAEGVQNFRGGMAIVGEAGPELVRLPRGSDVLPNNQSFGAGGLAGVTINQTNNITDPTDWEANSAKIGFELAIR